MDALAIYRGPPNRFIGPDTQPRTDNHQSHWSVSSQRHFRHGADTPFSFSDEQAELLQQLFAADASMSLAPWSSRP
ncbi:hypothetical protein CDV36_012086 [Fusarium kuroshium]|uniref:Uncharacterized protein n=1 Tax=Fusarium kuroshium TaxID=2010991 RepID=A0A3M2RSL8_9HYPO|nr:hypothetical protein CDV36_012086 [Fusarium kuroshium]